MRIPLIASDHADTIRARCQLTPSRFGGCLSNQLKVHKSYHIFLQSIGVTLGLFQEDKMNKFWTNVAKVYSRLDHSFWSWFPNNIETLIAQQLAVVFLLTVVRDSTYIFIYLIPAFLSLFIFSPYNLYLLNTRNNNEK